MTMPPRLLRRCAFALFAVALATATHWPALTLGAEAGRSDLFVHAVAFACWTALLIAAEPFGPWHTRRDLALAAAVGLAYAAIDEASQALPILRRTAAWDDFGANAVGSLAASAGAALLARFRRRTETAAP